MVLRHFRNLRREVKLFEVWDLGYDAAHDQRQALAAMEDAGAESGQPRERIRDVHRALVLENVLLLLRLRLPAEDLIDVFLHRIIGDTRAVEEARLPIDADHRDRAGLKMNVRAVDLHGGLQEVIEL